MNLKELAALVAVRAPLLRVAYLLLACLTLLPVAGAGRREVHDDYLLHLPLVLQRPCTASGNVVFGCVEQNGIRVAGVSVRLDFLDDGPPRQTIATTVTDAQGVYSFANVPSAVSPDQYEVRFENTSNPARLWQWYTPLTYTAGSRLSLPLMDITNIPLLDPPHNAQITLPYTFTWGARINAIESYRLIIVPVSGSGGFISDYVQHGSGYRLDELTSGLQYGKEYQWYLWINGGTQPLVSAYSLSARRFTFVPAANASAQPRTIAASSARRLLGSAWVEVTEKLEP